MKGKTISSYRVGERGIKVDSSEKITKTSDPMLTHQRLSSGVKGGGDPGQGGEGRGKKPEGVQVEVSAGEKASGSLHPNI